MSYKTFNEQVLSHIEFLRSNGLDVEALAIGSDFVRCHAIDANERGRGEYAYKSQKNSMRKAGMAGLVTWCRAPGGHELTHKTYGSDGISETCNIEVSLVKGTYPLKSAPSKNIGSKACFLWDQAKTLGRSEYLELKGVGVYGIRFLENEYGRVAVIPALDASGTLQTLQFLNPNGKKRFLTGSVGTGLFHKLGEPKNGQDIGLAESYVTAATCLELSGIPVICAFSSSNLPAVVKGIRKLYPEGRLIIFADNDRHHEERGEKNKGMKAAEKALSVAGPNSILAYPDFEDIAPGKDASDWNDLVRLKGKEEAQRQITYFLHSHFVELFD